MLLILDCDGVLVDSEVVSNRVLAEALTAIGVPMTVERSMAEFMGRSAKHVVERSAELLGATLPDGFYDRYAVARDDALARELQAVPGVAAALDAVEAAGVATCVASSGDHVKMRFTLGLTGLYERFAGRIFSTTEVEHGKPAPDLFLHAAERMGAAPAD